LLIGNALLKTCKIKMANENASLDNATSKWRNDRRQIN
jgi:hypothetical protein